MFTNIYWCCRMLNKKITDWLSPEYEGFKSTYHDIHSLNREFEVLNYICDGFLLLDEVSPYYYCWCGWATTEGGLQLISVHYANANF